MRDNGTREPAPSSGSGAHIKPVEWTRTEHQLTSHESFAPEALVLRGDLAIVGGEGRTMQLAKPAEWTTPDMPCVQRVPTGNQKDPYDTNDRRVAKLLCAGCPVRQECLDDAMADEEGLGARSRYLVRGGLTPWGRAELASRLVTND